MTFGRAAAAALALIVLLAAALFLGREAIVNAWLDRRLAHTLAAAAGGNIELQEVSWRNGVLRAGQAAWSGGPLRDGELRATDVRAAVAWKQLFDPLSQPLHVEIGAAEWVLADREETSPASPAPTADRAVSWPPVDLLVGRLTLRHASHEGWALRDTATRAVREGGTWAFSARGGTAAGPGAAALEIERISASHDGKAWKIGGFALREADGGMLAGSAAEESGAWSGELSWQDIDLARLLPPDLAERASGRISGDASLRESVLRGQAKVTGGKMTKLPQFVKMASLFAGEDWNEVPWDVFRFDFTREADGGVVFEKLQAVSPKGIALHGAGSYAPDRLEAKLQLGVAQANRPWLLAFMPVIFRAEQSGYFWTTVNISGTPEQPVEDLSARLAAAVAVVPATTAVEAAAEIPGTAVEAAGGLLRSLLGR
jgi:hypothetical protein